MKQKGKPRLAVLITLLMPPLLAAADWTAQPWFYAGPYQGAHEISRTLQRYDALDLPIWAVVLDHWTDIEAPDQIDLRRYPKPRTWIRALENHGLHVFSRQQPIEDLALHLPNGIRWAHPQPATWEGLQATLTEMLETPDRLLQPIGGIDIPSKPLYLRWISFAVFSPLLMLGPEPWSYDQETLDLARHYFQVRERLQPHLVHWGQVLHDGAPVPLMRPVPDTTDQYFFGPHLMIAPILANSSYRDVYMPDGDWIELRTGAEIEGQVRYEAVAGLDSIPIFCRVEAYNLYRDLLQAAPRAPVPTVSVPTVSVEVLEPLDERGVHRQQMHWRPGPSPYRFRFRLVHDHKDALYLGVRLGAPARVEVEPAQIIRFGLEPGEDREILFTVTVPDDLAPGSYPLPLELRADGEDVPTPAQWLVIHPRWRILGPFEGGVGTDPSGEGLLPDLHATFTGIDGAVLAWQKLGPEWLRPHGDWDLSGLTGDDPYTTRYLSTEWFSPLPRRARIWIGSGDAVTVWLNQVEIYQAPYHRNAVRDDEVVEVILLGGTNQVMVRTSRDLAPNRLYLRLE